MSAAAGLLLMVIIILILWKCGFFERKKYQYPGATHQAEMKNLMDEDEPDADMKRDMEQRMK